MYNIRSSNTRICSLIQSFWPDQRAIGPATGLYLIPSLLYVPRQMPRYRPAIYHNRQSCHLHNHHHKAGSTLKSDKCVLTLKAPPIICSRRQLKILPPFQNNKLGMIFSCNIIPYFCEIGKDVTKFFVCCSRD